MSRMPMHVLYSFRYAFRASVFAVAIAIFALFSPTAHADPHAVFYTDRAQEQVFFNTLAALNQADFVEPGLADGTPNNRSFLLSRRQNEAVRNNVQPTVSPEPFAFGQEQNPLITSTRTNLPGVVSRNITLEGDDLWTAYLVHQLALETATRRSTDELARIFCERGLGRAGCLQNDGAAQQQETAFVTDSGEHINQEGLAVTAALSSGDPEEKAFQDKLTGTQLGGWYVPGNPTQTAANLAAVRGQVLNEPQVADSLKFPRPSSPELAALRSNNAAEQENLNLINTTTAGLLASQYNSGLDPNAFSDLKIDNKGKVEVPEDITFEEYAKKMDGIGSFLPSLVSIAAKSRQQAETFKYYRENSLALADYALTKQQGGGVKATITTPSSAKAALVEEGAALATNLSINQKFANPDAINRTGTQNLVPRVKGITTSDPSAPSNVNENGKVAGIASSIYSLYQSIYGTPTNKALQDPNESKDPTDNAIAPSQESGVNALLKALTDGNYRKGNPVPSDTECGAFCTNFNQIIAGATATGDGLVNAIYAELRCALFPTADYCKPTTP